MNHQNCLTWLKSQNEYPKFYWKNKYSQESIASSGIKKKLSKLTPSKHFANCVFDFELHNMNIWVPKYEVSSLQPFEKFNNSLDRIEKYEIVHKSFLPDFSLWKNLLLKAKDIQKVVLARTTYLKLDKTICPFLLMQRLEKKAGSAHLFFYQPHEGTTLLGASPETLFMREEDCIFSEAIAGTRKLGKTESENRQIFHEFINSKKDIEEFSYVDNFLSDNFRELCKNYKKSELNILKTPWVQHFQKTFQGQLKEQLSDWSLLKKFHPTPAVGGIPVNDALAFIEKNEPFARNYYAAPIGRASKDKSEFAVGIRSCLIKNDTIQVFAGTGLVKDSQPQSEWEELDSKTRWIYEMLNA